MNWADAEAPSLDDFAKLAEAALDMVPQALRARCGEIVLRVADFADDEMLDALDLDDPFALTGVYQGVDLTQKTSFDVSGEPDSVFLYRRPILDEWAERGDVTLGELITHVLIHEIGHHFGFSDDDMDRLQDG
ncbi:MAG: metallopeptidase family protein [Maricaulaceae bacterium]|jgi:predicted Zn-dependent protease with MMP-like domain